VAAIIQVLPDVLQAGHSGDVLPALRVHPQQVRDLDDHAETDLTQAVGVLTDVVHDFLLLLASEARVIQHTMLDDLADPNEVVTAGLDGEVEIVTSGDHRLEVRGQTVATRNHAVEVVVGDEHHRTLEDEVPRKALALIVLHASLSKPGEPADRSRVAGAFQEVQTDVVEKDAVSVVEDHDLALLAVLVECLIEAGRTDEALDDSELDVVAEFVDDLVNSVALTESGRARDDQGAV